MSLRVDNRNFLNRLQQRFGAFFKADEEKPSISEQVQPVTIADDLLKNNRVFRGTTTHAAVGPLVIFTCPAKKRYTIYWLTVGITANATVDSWFIFQQASGTQYIECERYTATATPRFVVLHQPIILEPDMCIKINLAARTGAGSGYYEMLCVEEDLY